MVMIKHLLILLLSLISLAVPSMAQVVTVGKAIEKTVREKHDSSFMTIIDSWSRYVETHSKAQESTAEMWVNRDTARFLASYNGKTEKHYDHEIFRIDSYGNGEYGFSVKAVHRGKAARKTYGLRSINYYMYALETEEGIKFMAPLDYGVYNDIIIRKTCGHIDFYFPHDFRIDETGMIQCSEFIDSLVSMFGLEEVRQINYVISENYASSKLIAGILMHDDGRSSGVSAEFVYPDTILAGRICHKHELTHSVLYQHYPDAHRLIHEGLAIYLDTDAAGKYRIEDYMGKIKRIKDADDLSALLQTDSGLYYSIARHIIKTVFETEGIKAISDILKMKTDDEIYGLFSKIFE